MISATLVAWGLLTALTGLVHTPGQLYFARFVLGGAEAGFFPGVIDSAVIRDWLAHCRLDS